MPSAQPTHGGPPSDLLTTRLRLTPLTRESSAAAISDRAALARLLNAEVPADWPPIDLADVEPMLAAELSQHPECAGWLGWYIVAQPSTVAAPAILIGSAGCTRWGAGNALQFGYGLLPAYFGKGFATEAAQALIDWVFTHEHVTRVEATTFERHFASVKILERCGFVMQGVSPNDAEAPESDRQGRGRLMLFTRERASCEAHRAPPA